MSEYAKFRILNHTVEFKRIPTSGQISVGIDGRLVGNFPTARRAIFEAAENVRMIENLSVRPTMPEEVWQSVEEFAPPEPLEIEVSTCNETIRQRSGLEDVSGLDHPFIGEACAAYYSAATGALLDAGGRISVRPPKGQRVLHSGWAGARFSYSAGAIGTMAKELTDEERKIIDDANDAGLAAAKKVIEDADAFSENG